MTGIHRRISRSAAALSALLATGGLAMAGSLGGPLELQDDGSFFINGQTTSSSHPGTSAFSAPQPGTILVPLLNPSFAIEFAA